MPHKRFIIPLFLFLFFSCLVFVRYYSVWYAHWSWDDPYLLLKAMQYSPAQYFFMPSVWQDVVPSFFTPWLYFSFDIDVSIFGLNPLYFYGHHLLSLSFLLCILFMVLRLWMPPRWALLACSFSVFLAPFQVVTYQLMDRHYIEGLIFALMSLWCWVTALKKDKDYLSILSAVFYLLACLSKEIYVPLFMVLWFLPDTEKTFKQRLTFFVPLGMALCLYLIWRYWMLDMWVGGYAQIIEWQAVFFIPWRFMQALWGNGAWIAVFILPVVFYLFYSMPSARLFMLVLLGVIVAPLIPVSNLLQDVNNYRVFLLPSIVFTVGFTYAIMQLHKAHFRFIANGGLALFVASLLWQNYTIVESFQAMVKSFSARSQFIEQHDEQDVLWAHTLYFDEVLRQVYLGEKGASNVPWVMVDLLEYEENSFNTKNIYTYSADCECMENITAQLPEKLAAWQQAQVEKPLEVHIQHISGHRVQWSFAPYAEGQYFLLNPDFLGRLPLPAQGQIRSLVPDPLSYCIRYDDPEGWVTYSPWRILHKPE